MTRHTPGPWKYAAGERGFWGNRDEPPEPGYPPTIWATIEDHEVRLAEIHDPVYMADSIDEYDDGTRLHGDTEANARLIAAAPDLLEALVMLMHCGPHPRMGEWKRAVQNAASAIDKAEGKS
jgi:hypothetical protein